MVALLQRVTEASVTVEGTLKGQIQQGLLVFLGITVDDTVEDAEKIAQKIINIRIFSDSEGKMNLSLLDVKGDILLISQFTLCGSTKKGNRPSYIAAARPEQAIPLYESVIKALSEKIGKPIQTGVFGADMKVALLNDGPVTVTISTGAQLF
jgi:D-tyrosyl-tRNA(Tyr) deacylase